MAPSPSELPTRTNAATAARVERRPQRASYHRPIQVVPITQTARGPWYREGVVAVRPSTFRAGSGRRRDRLVGGLRDAPRPTIDPGYAARAYTPPRVAVLPPDVFVVVDQVGDNDPAQSAALGQQVSAEIVQAAEQALRAAATTSICRRAGTASTARTGRCW